MNKEEESLIRGDRGDRSRWQKWNSLSLSSLSELDGVRRDNKTGFDKFKTEEEGGQYGRQRFDQNLKLTVIRG